MIQIRNSTVAILSPLLRAPATSSLLNRRCSSARSALLVSGRHRTYQAQPFSPSLDFSWIEAQRSKLEQVALLRKEKLDMTALLRDLKQYHQLCLKISELDSKKDKLANLIKLRKTAKEKVSDSVSNEFKEIKTRLNELKESLWTYQEGVLLDLLNLQNCDNDSIFENKIVVNHGEEPGDEDIKLGHRDIGEREGLIHFSDNSHTAFYLLHDLALLELRLCRHVASHNFRLGVEAVSAPDLVKSVVLEGCGLPYSNPDSMFSLRPGGEYGKIEDGLGMHLVGGASLPALMAYFARNVVTNPEAVLPMVLGCQGRYYQPQPQPGPWNLYSSQQSTAHQWIGVGANSEQLSSCLNSIQTLLKEILIVLPNFRMEEQGLQHCSRSDTRRFSITVKAKERVEVGHIAVQGDYFSRRMMIRAKKDEKYTELHTVSAHLNLTKLLAAVLEFSQGDKRYLDDFRDALS